MSIKEKVDPVALIKKLSEKLIGKGIDPTPRTLKVTRIKLKAYNVLKALGFQIIFVKGNK